jgi:hypothetical protein
VHFWVWLAKYASLKRGSAQPGCIPGGLRFRSKADTLIDYDEDVEETSTVENRNDIVLNYNWELNKRLQLTVVTSQKTDEVGAIHGVHHFAPVNDSRNMIPFFCVLLQNAAEFLSSADLPTVKTCARP